LVTSLENRASLPRKLNPIKRRTVLEGRFDLAEETQMRIVDLGPCGTWLPRSVWGSEGIFKW
jgi:hypothetical protein